MNSSGLVSFAFMIFATITCAWAQPSLDQPNPVPPSLTVEIKPIQTCKGYFGEFADISPDGKLLASVHGKHVCLWNLTNGKQVAAFVVSERDNAHRAIFSPDGKTLACTCGDNCTVYLLTTASGNVLRRIGPCPSSARVIAFAADGKSLLTVCNDARLRIWNVATGDEIKKNPLSKLEGDIGSAAFSADCRRISLQIEGDTCLFDVESGKEVWRDRASQEHNCSDRGFIFSPDGGYLAAPVWAECAIRLWDTTTGKTVRYLTWPKDTDAKKIGAFGLSFSLDCKSIMAACQDGQVRVWEVATGGLCYQVEEPTTFVAAIRGGSLVATENYAKSSLHVWDILNPTKQKPAEIPAKQIDKLWTELGSLDSRLAYQALTSLFAANDEAVRLIGKRLKAVEAVDEDKLTQLITDLDGTDFQTREAASRQLEKLGEMAKVALVKAQEQGSSAEARRRIDRLLVAMEDSQSADRLQIMRAMEVLEGIRSSEARELLQRLASGASGAPLTIQATASLKRLKQD